MMMYLLIAASSAAAVSCWWWAGIWWSRQEDKIAWLDIIKGSLWLILAVSGIIRVTEAAGPGSLNVIILQPTTILLALVHVVQHVAWYRREREFEVTNEEVIEIIRNGHDEN